MTADFCSYPSYCPLNSKQKQPTTPCGKKRYFAKEVAVRLSLLPQSAQLKSQSLDGSPLQKDKGGQQHGVPGKPLLALLLGFQAEAFED